VVTSPPDTAGRFRRLLAILAWLAQVQEAPLDEAAARFEMSPESLVAELEMAACCGVPPYTPDQLMEIVVTDTTVSARLGPSLARPRRLSPHEGFALAAAARALLATPGSDENGALSRALTKLERALGGELRVELDSPPLLPEVQAAVEAGASLRVTYYSASTDRLTERDIRPVSLFAAEGHWYVDAWSGTAGDMRRFRVDRISKAQSVGNEAAGPAGSAPPDVDSVPLDTASTAGAAPQPGDPGFAVFVPGPDNRRVRLFLDRASMWLVESVPSAGPPEPVADGVEVEVFVGGTAWLERLLLRLGPGARVVEPAEDRGLAGDAARRILRRYGVAAGDEKAGASVEGGPPS
jgi:predicted DNA-binding transcriptional regulator YafY